MTEKRTYKYIFRDLDYLEDPMMSILCKVEIEKKIIIFIYYIFMYACELLPNKTKELMTPRK